MGIKEVKDFIRYKLKIPFKPYKGMVDGIYKIYTKFGVEHATFDKYLLLEDGEEDYAWQIIGNSGYSTCTSEILKVKFLK